MDKDKSLEELKQEYFQLKRKQEKYGNVAYVFGLLACIFMIGLFVITYTTKTHLNVSILEIVIFVLILLILLVVYAVIGASLISKATQNINEFNEKVKQRYEIKEIPIYPSLEMGIQGDYETLFNQITEIFHKNNLSNIKADKQTGKISAVQELMPRGVWGKINVIGILSQKWNNPKIDISITKISQEIFNLKLCVKGNKLKGFTYDLLKTIEKDIVSIKKYKILSYEPVVENKKLFKKDLKKSIITVIFIFVVIPLIIGIGIVIYEKITMTEAIDINSVNQLEEGKLYYLFGKDCNNISGGCYGKSRPSVLINNIIYFWCEDKGDCFIYNLTNFEQSKINYIEYKNRIGYFDSFDLQKQREFIYNKYELERIDKGIKNAEYEVKIYGGGDNGRYSIKIKKIKNVSEGGQDYITINRAYDSIMDLVIYENKVLWRESKKKEWKFFIYVIPS